MILYSLTIPGKSLTKFDNSSRVGKISARKNSNSESSYNRIALVALEIYAPSLYFAKFRGNKKRCHLHDCFLPSGQLWYEKEKLTNFTHGKSQKNIRWQFITACIVRILVMTYTSVLHIAKVLTSFPLT